MTIDMTTISTKDGKTNHTEVANIPLHLTKELAERKSEINPDQLVIVREAGNGKDISYYFRAGKMIAYNDNRSCGIFPVHLLIAGQRR